MKRRDKHNYRTYYEYYECHPSKLLKSVHKGESSLIGRILIMFLKQGRIRLGLKEKRASSLNEETIKILSFRG